MHDNSLATYAELKADLNKRARDVLDFFEFRASKRDGFTDREVQHLMGFEERNDVQPRISELVDKKLLKEVGKRPCKKTGRPVRACVWNPNPNDDQKELGLWA